MMYKFLLLFFILFHTIFANETDQNKKYKIICLDNSGTEILFKLNLGGYIVGKNSTCSFPTEVSQITSVGDHNSMNLEGILNLKPTHLIVNDQISDLQSSQIESIGSITLIKLTTEASAQGISDKISIIAKNFKVEKEAILLIASIQKEFNEVLQNVRKFNNPSPKYLCVYMRGVDSLFTLSNDSGASELCNLVGAKPCFSDLKKTTPLNSEAFVIANPDVFVVFTSGLKSVGGTEGFLNIPGVGLTKAGKNKRIIAVDGSLLSNYGPRTGIAAKKLFDAIHSSEGYVEIK